MVFLQVIGVFLFQVLVQLDQLWNLNHSIPPAGGGHCRATRENDLS